MPADAAGVAALFVLAAGTAAALAGADALGALAKLVPELAGAVAAALGLGKNVASLPLCTCHASQSNTKENANTAHNRERRISFMRMSFQKKRER